MLQQKKMKRSPYFRMLITGLVVGAITIGVESLFVDDVMRLSRRLIDDGHQITDPLGKMVLAEALTVSICLGVGFMLSGLILATYERHIGYTAEQRAADQRAIGDEPLAFTLLIFGTPLTASLLLSHEPLILGRLTLLAWASILLILYVAIVLRR